MNETLQRINQLSDERLSLYRLAGKQRLSAEQHQQLMELPAKLEVLWDQYRREVASNHRGEIDSAA
jgi:hypothetical protein